MASAKILARTTDLTWPYSANFRPGTAQSGLGKEFAPKWFSASSKHDHWHVSVLCHLQTETRLLLLSNTGNVSRIFSAMEEMRNEFSSRFDQHAWAIPSKHDVCCLVVCVCVCWLWFSMHELGTCIIGWQSPHRNTHVCMWFPPWFQTSNVPYSPSNPVNVLSILVLSAAAQYWRMFCSGVPTSCRCQRIHATVRRRPCLSWRIEKQCTYMYINIPNKTLHFLSSIRLFRAKNWSRTVQGSSEHHGTKRTNTFQWWIQGPIVCLGTCMLEDRLPMPYPESARRIVFPGRTLCMYCLWLCRSISLDRRSKEKYKLYESDKWASLKILEARGWTFTILRIFFLALHQ